MRSVESGVYPVTIVEILSLIYIRAYLEGYVTSSVTWPHD